MTNKFSRLTALMAFSLAVLFFASFQISAAVNDTFTIDDLKYTVLTEEGSTGTVSVKSNNSYISGNVVIPSSVENGEYTYSVTILLDNAFYDCRSLTGVTIPNGVTSIGNSAFYCCSSLTDVIIPDSVTSIGDSAFWGCNKLPSVLFSIGKKILVRYSYSNAETSYTIPDTVTYIAGSAFYNCGSLNNITIPDSVTSIGDSAFSMCFSLTNVTIPHNVTFIGDNVFSSCQSLVEIVVDSTNRDYSSRDGVLFNKDQTLLIKYPAGKVEASYTIPDKVTSIGESAFTYCESLKSITFSDSVTSIGKEAFSECSNLTDVVVPDNVKEISDYAFFRCSNLSSIVIGNSVMTIGKGAFLNCNLIEIKIPESVTSIGESAFTGCRYLKNVILPNTVASISNGVFTKCGSLTHIVVPDSVTSIGSFAFSGCSNLVSIDIPDSVISIGDNAFQSCRNLTSIKIPEKLTTINVGVFYDCTNLTYIEFPENITNIKTSAFSGCNLRAVYFRGRMPTVEENSEISLSAPNSYHLEDALGWPSLYQTVCKGWFTLDDIIYVYKSDGTAIASAYIGHETEANILEKITVNNVIYKVCNIGYKAFFNDDTLEKVNIPEGITSIDAYAFQNCSYLGNIELLDNVISIGNYAFSNCTGLKSAVLGSGVTYINSGLFFGCGELSQIIIGENVYSISSDAFTKCDNLNWIYFDGNPPSPTTAFANVPAKVIYYRAGNNNWPKVWEGFPTEEWVEAPQIVIQPQSQQVIEGDLVTFVVEAKGTAPLNYQWYKDDIAIEGAISEIYAIESVTAEDLGNYQVVVTNTEGEAVSNIAVLSLLQTPTITVNPVSVTVDNGTNVVFTVEALNADSYQWYKDGDAISGATETTYSIDCVKGSDVGTYTAMVINRAGVEKSSPAALSLTQPYRATAELQMVNGTIVGVTVTDCGWGYEFEPKVRIKDEFGEGAEAHCVVEGGMVTAIILDNPGSGYSEETTVKVGSPFKYVGMKAEVKQIKLTLYLVLGETYQLEACTDLSTHDWKRIGDPFIADEEETEVTVEVLETGRYFRVHEVK